VDVGEGAPERRSRRSRREPLVAVAEEHEQVRGAPRKHLGEAEHPEAEGLGRPERGVRGKERLDPLGHGEPVGLDDRDGLTELGPEVRAGDEEAQLERRVAGEALEERPVDPVVGAGDGDEPDDAPHQGRPAPVRGGPPGSPARLRSRPVGQAAG